MNATSESQSKTLVLNPVSGSGDHAERIRNKAAATGYNVEETEEAGDAIELAKAAANDGSTLIGAAGGDGTLNEVVRGVDAADAFDRVTVGVIPAGTGNNFAKNIGVSDIDEGFDVLENGERRWIDLGDADGNLFINSCISGITAEASGETTPELKNKYGVLAYVINTFQTVSEYDRFRLSVDIWRGNQHDPVWVGDAIMVLIGNGRRLSIQGNTQANMEDGLFDVAIVEQAPTADLVGEALADRVLGRDSSHTIRRSASSVELSGLETEPTSFSLDGEIVEQESLSLDVRERALSVAVGESYEPNPGYEW